MFKNRTDAGRKLAKLLEKYRDTAALVLAIPRGGVEVGAAVADFLNAELSIIVTRKLAWPTEPEAGFGAVAEDGSVFIAAATSPYLSKKEVACIVSSQKMEIKRRIEVLRGGAPLPALNGRTVILVDDGIAMGSTMTASISLCRRRQAARIVAASPVAGAEVKNRIKALADEVAVLETPPGFRAVADAYEDWYDVGDEEVLKIMDKWKNRRKGGNKTDRDW